MSVVMDTWDQLLEHLERTLDPQTFDTWFRPTSMLGTQSGVLLISVPNEVFRDWLTQKYAGLVREALELFPDSPADVRFIVEDQHTEMAPAVPVAAAPVPESGPSGATLNPKYTFGSFVVGASNQFAHAAARAVAEGPSRSYNPLFLYGGVGLGKTHLMLAIGHHIRNSLPDLRIVYLSSERFMNELINSIRYDRTHEFRERYRNIDVLLMDDIQFLAGKERTQEEFFHTFNALHEEQKQIVVTSDAPPKEIPTLEERLQSRFEWGLLADIQPPDLETKVAILKKKAAAEAPSKHLPDDVLLYIATASKSNIRELEGALIRLLAYASLTGDEISLELTKTVLRDTLRTGETAITIDTIQDRVAEFYGLRPGELNSRSNARRITRPRQVAMFLCKELTPHSLPEIGRAFGGKHHSTVIHSVRKVKEQMGDDNDLQRGVTNLLESFR
ncbi:MAG: chromosomal replication initiator protein DnaA [Acidobacteria bacterium]|nr:chromosomal replication initiator protein DnaA [Acidobacteriota bacterium]